MFSDLDESFSVQLNFCIFQVLAIFAIMISVWHCFAKFHKSSCFFCKFGKYEFCKVSQIQVSQFYICLARVCKVSQIQVLQGFANRFFVSQSFASFARFLQWAVCWWIWPSKSILGKLNLLLTAESPSLFKFLSAWAGGLRHRPSLSSIKIESSSNFGLCRKPKSIIHRNTFAIEFRMSIIHWINEPVVIVA